MNTSHAPLRYMVTALAIFGTCFVLDWAICRAEPSDTGDEQGVQVLTRGPVHEAFAGVVTFNPEPGVVAPKAPPEIIEELPPDERPEGDHVTWIPGYWAWDDERNDFLWVSGVWRALPPGRQWVAGYWGRSGQGFQWTSGYWADATVNETAYLSEPPATVEAGPNVGAPSLNYTWIPGCWVWYQGRYAWRPGYWAEGRSDWDWVPAYYAWTPHGYVFVDGYWDYSVERRGVLFAPVYFESGVYARRGYSYSPTIAIDLSGLLECLFLRPNYHHYYFGDYYATSYHDQGFYPSFLYSSSGNGYDPIYAHQHWEHRQDSAWANNVATTFQSRRDHVSERPLRTWEAQQSTGARAVLPNNGPMLATPLAQLVKRKDTPMRFQPVAKEERQKFAQLGQEVQKSRDARQTLESKTVDRSAGKPGQALEPSVAKPPQSPTVGKSADQLGKGQAPPDQHKVPESDSKIGPALGASTPETNVRTNKPQPESSKPVSKEQPVPTSAESRDTRQTLESKTVDRSAGRPSQVLEPTIVKLPRSPIVGRSAAQLGKGQAPPDKHKVPAPDLKVEPKPKVFTPAPNVQSNEPRREPTKAAQERPAAEQPAKREDRPAAEQPSKP